MNTAIITIGISASGKSTFAEDWVNREFNRIEINRDKIRRQLMEKDGKEWSWQNWSWKREKEVTVLVNKELAKAAQHKKDIIVSDTNLNSGRRDELINRLNGYGYNVEIKEFPITLDEAWKRDAARVNGVGHSVIATQYEQWLKYKGRKTYIADITKPPCILVDIDGTLAHMNGKRSAFEWDKVGVDDVDHTVRTIVKDFSDTPYTDRHVIILSGRDGICESETRSWLSKNGIDFDHLYMRQPNDMRKDTIVKEEIFWKNIADNYIVQFVIDDRPSVCRMWRELGLKVFQVGNPHIEF